MSTELWHEPHHGPCGVCREQPHSDTAQQHRDINRLAGVPGGERGAQP
jgi:hypothetical protein